jgi:hypothetical protein
MIITNRDGRKFFIRVVFRGDSYGRNDCLEHDDDMPMIEFYDWTYRSNDFGPRGQFVSRYNADTLARRDDSVGLNLQGDVSVWWVDSAAMEPVDRLAQELISA